MDIIHVLGLMIFNLGLSILDFEHHNYQLCNLLFVALIAGNRVCDETKNRKEQTLFVYRLIFLLVTPQKESVPFCKNFSTKNRITVSSCGNARGLIKRVETFKNSFSRKEGRLTR